MNMLPPVDLIVLDNNPRFAKLYKDLTTAKLNGDATSKNAKIEKNDGETHRKLNAHRVAVAKEETLQHALRRVMLRDDLPPELYDVMQVVCAQLQGRLKPEDQDLIADDIDYFLENLAYIAPMVDEYLSNTATHLVRIAHPLVSDSTTLSLPISVLPTTITKSRSDIADQTIALAHSRMHLASLISTLISAHQSLLRTSISIHERTIHGSHARYSRAKAEHLATVARGMALKTVIAGRSEDVDGDLVQALKGFEEHVKGEVRELQVTERKTRAALEGYEKARGMKDLAERLRTTLDEIRVVEEELARFEVR